MGRGKERHKEFLSRHPICCFCGGMRAATTEDHFPSRSMFRDRRWPEGYVFPACASCNAATAKDELIIAMLGRMFPDPQDPDHKQQIVNLMQSVNNNFPGLLASMQMSANEKKKWLKERGVAIPAGMTTADVGLMSAADPRIEGAAKKFATKLFLALLYYHTGKILKSTGGVIFRWATNEQNLEEVFPQEILQPLLQGFPVLKRANTSLEDQFFYRYAIADTGQAGAFLTFFNQSMAMLGFLFPEIDSVAVPQGAIVLRPLDAS